MRQDAVKLEEQRLKPNDRVEQPVVHERHRVFPRVFEDRRHRRVIDVASGVGYVAQRVRDGYAAEMICNDLSPTCLEQLRARGLPAVRYTIDSPEPCFPFANGTFDAVIALATIEHILEVDTFVREVSRILASEGCFYLSAPNYAGLLYLLPVLWSGRTFHNPMQDPARYEFYAHVRYFTYQTLLDYIPQFGFQAEAVYLPVPRDSTRYQEIRARSRLKALAFRWGMEFFYRLSPRWSSEPVICFRKTERRIHSIRRVIL